MIECQGQQIVVNETFDGRKPSEIYTEE